MILFTSGTLILVQTTFSVETGPTIAYILKGWDENWTRCSERIGEGAVNAMQSYSIHHRKSLLP